MRPTRPEELTGREPQSDQLSSSGSPRKPYKAFISYSHAADGKLAPALQSALHSFAKPWNRLRAVRVFRDKTNLSANPNLWTAIEKAIGESEWFLLMASPEAARSKWVPREIATFLHDSTAERIILVLTDGDVIWDNANSDFDWQATTAFPNLGQKTFGAEPLYLDLRWARKEEDLSLRNPAFRDAVADLSSSLRGVPKDILSGQDVLEHKKTLRLARTAGTLLAILVVGLGFATYSAIQQRNLALQRLVRAYVTNGVRAMDDGDFLASIPWFVEALRMEQSDAARVGTHRLRLAAALSKCPRLSQIWFNEVTPEKIAFSWDGRRVFTVLNEGAGMDRWTGRVWDAASGSAIPPSLEGDGEVSTAAFSPDGGRILILSYGGVARVWDLATGKASSVPHGGGAAVVHAEFTQSGDVLTVSQGGTVRRWNTAKGAQSDLMRGVNSVAKAQFSRGQQRLLLLDDEGMMRVWNVRTGQRVSPVVSASIAGVRLDDPDHLIFSPDGRRAVLLFGEGQVWIWDVDRSSLRLLRDAKQISEVAFSPDGRRLATASFLGMAQVWDAATGKEIALLLGHRGSVDYVTFSADGRRVLTAGDDHMARVWDAVSGKTLLSVEHDGFTVNPVFSPNGVEILTARTSGREIRLWDIEEVAVKTQFVHHDGVTMAAFNRTGSLLATGSRDGTARIWNVSTGNLERSIFHPPAVNYVAFSPDNRHFITGGSDSAARIWDLATGESVGEPLRHYDEVVYVAFASDNRRVAVVSGTLFEQGRVWEVATGKPVASPLLQSLLQKGTLSKVMFSPNGRLVATVGNNDLETVQVRDIMTGKPVTPPFKHARTVVGIFFSPDGKRILSTEDLQAHLWDIRTGKTVAPSLIHGTFIDYAGFSPDGRLAVTTSSDYGSVRLWDATTGEAVTPRRQTQSPMFAAFSPNGSRVIVVGEKAEMWDLVRENRAAEDLELLARVLSARRIDSSGGQITLEVEELEQDWQKLRGGVR